MMRAWLAFAALLLIASPAMPQSRKVDGGVIEGRVTRPGGTEGIPEVEVTLLGPAPEGDSGPQQSMYTDFDGRFSFKSLPEGRYTVAAQRDGYFGLPPVGGAGAFPPLQVSSNATIIAGYTPPAISLTLTRGGVISGHLRDPNGRLIPNIAIQAYQITYRDGRGVLTAVKSGQTDDRGEYRLFWMAPGNYVVAASPRRSGTVPSPQDVYARTFYPGLIDARTVPPVVVTDGADIPSVDILIRTDAIAKIAGRVVSPFAPPNGQPNGPSTMYLIPRDPNALAESSVPTVQNMASNRAGGRFELRNVLPGSYDLLASVAEGPGAAGRTAWGRTRVDVGSVDLEDVIVDMRTGYEIKVRLSIDGDPGISVNAATSNGARGDVSADLQLPGEGRGENPQNAVRPSMEVRLLSREPYTTLDNTANANMTFDPQGTVYTFPNVPEGRYRFQVTPLPPNAYVEDVREGSVSIFDEGLSVAGIPAGEIAVLINTKGAAVKGVVSAADQSPFEGALVALVPALPHRSNLTLYKSVRTDDKGVFAIDGVAPGEYRMFAWEFVPANAWLNADFIALQEGRGKSVMVTAGGSATADLKLIPREIR